MTGDSDEIDLGADVEFTAGQTITFWVRLYQIGSSGSNIFPGVAANSTGGSFDSYLSFRRADGTNAALTSGEVSVNVRGEDDGGSGFISDAFTYDLDTNPAIPVAIVFEDDDSFTVHVNGAEAGGDSGSFIKATLGVLGAGYGGASNGGRGGKDLDNVRRYDAALTRSQLDDVEAGKSISATLLNEWRFDEGEGTTAEDTAGSNDGTISGASYLEGFAADATDTDLYDVRPLRDAFQRFASGATLPVLDADGTKIDAYPYGQRVEVQFTEDGGSTWTTRQAGVALDAERTNRDGLPSVEVPIVAYNHFLTRDSIEKDYSSTTKTDILNDVITTFTPINWVAGNVDVQDDTAIDLSVRGERPDEVIARIASASGEEDWGVNDDFEFFFRQQDTNRAAEVTDDDVIDFDLPREGRRAINEFSVYYGSDLSNVWTDEDREVQQQLKDQLDAPRRVVISDADSFPEVSTEAEAKKIAERRLGTQKVVQTGTIVTPLGFFDTEPGDVFELTLGDAGIDGEDFRVAQIEYNWIKGTEERVIAENTGADIDELLIALSDSLHNDRMRDADPNATEVRALRLDSGVTLSLTATLTTKEPNSGAFIVGQSEVGEGSGDTVGGGISASSTVTIESKRLTVGMLNLIRDQWQDGNSAFVDLTHLAVGTDDTGATRADDSLEAETARVAVDKFGAGNAAEKFEFVAEIPPGGALADGSDLRELSIADAASAGTHYLRLTFDDVDITSTRRLKVHLEVEIDVDTDEQGVITSTGQERMRDLLIGESNHEPSDMVWGTGTTAASESDTSLGSKSHEDTIDSTEDGSPGLARIIERVTAGDADTTNFSEVGLENAADELLQRIVWEAYGEDLVVEGILGMQATNA